jgi:FtsP/CotA-like multicopper oxidase with cupredoxin domain/plastocyanin
VAIIEYWIQLENRPWDASPHNIDRMTGQDMKAVTGKDPVDVPLKLPGGAPGPTRRMYNPLRDPAGKVKDALILRRYKPPTKPDKSDAWTVPDDRKVNPWDLNELDPTNSGTMGTIPGPVIECNVGDSVVVNFRNMDMRNVSEATTIHVPSPFGGTIELHIPAVPMPIEKRVHSLHPHGFVFKATSDGAYPLSPPDPAQPIPPSPDPEAAAWAGVPGFSGTLKKGDRVPPGGTFRYEWNTFKWPTTAGVWLYHDHSICDMENVELGAIGIVVIHNPQDTEQEVDIRDPADPMKLDPAFLPDGSANGSPVNVICFPFPGPKLPVLPHDLEGLGLRHAEVPGHAHAGHRPAPAAPAAPQPAPVAPRPETAAAKPAREEAGGSRPILERLIRRGDGLFELDDKLQIITKFCLRRYDPPPTKALYLQLYHMLSGGFGMMINGRSYLGNTPTLIAGRDTRMRFGIVGMGTGGSGIHTFHLHGHRWILPGPEGNTPGAIQGSSQVHPVSQFEDSRIFGPANSFVFTIDGQSGSFMRAGGPSPDDAIGEWHMHCHVLDHMMTGMMGSLLVVRGGELALALPVGVPCGHDGGGHNGGGHNGGGGTTPTAVTLAISGFAFQTGVKVKVGGTVTFKNNEVGDDHSVVWDTPGSPPNVPTISPGASSAAVTMSVVGVFNFHCGIHPSMLGSIEVLP